MSSFLIILATSNAMFCTSELIYSWSFFVKISIYSKLLSMLRGIKYLSLIVFTFSLDIPFTISRDISTFKTSEKCKLNRCSWNSETEKCNEPSSSSDQRIKEVDPIPIIRGNQFLVNNNKHHHKQDNKNSKQYKHNSRHNKHNNTWFSTPK